MKIVVLESDAMTPGGISFEVFHSFGEVTEYRITHQDELIERIREADAIFLNKLIIDKEVIDACPHLKYIGLFATGYNTIDVEYCALRGITVCNAGHYSTNAVAQHTFALILNYYNRITDYHNAVQGGSWEKSELTTLYDFPTDELDGKTVGIIGYGHIGRRVAELCHAFGMKVIVYTRTKKQDPAVRFVTFDELLAESDIISLHCPLTEENRCMMNREAFEKCRKKPFIVNTARGGLINEPDLRSAVLDGLISGAGLDAITVEPMRNCVLKGVENITITPHSAWAPVSTRQRLLDIVVECFKAWQDGKPINVVS